jgi:FlaA1/EpsC-like NDP-sugar epimerase
LVSEIECLRRGDGVSNSISIHRSTDLSGSKRKILVTGATGLIGGVLVRLLAGESGLQVVEAAGPGSSTGDS